MIEKLWNQLRESFERVYHGTGWKAYFFRAVVLLILGLIIYRAFA